MKVAESKGKITENKLAVFREFAKEVGCDLILEENLPNCLDVRIHPNMSGVYIQLRKRGEIYIGEAVDVLDRQKEHLVNGVHLAALAVLFVQMSRPQDRKEIETALIATAQKKGLRLANISKIRLAEEINRQTEQLSSQAALERLQGMDSQAVFTCGLGGWLESVEKAKAKATESDWERYSRFMLSPMAFEAMHIVSTFVRRVIAHPEATYGQTWNICINDSGYPGPEWISVRTQAGKVFEVSVVQTADDTILRVKVWVEKVRMDLFVERCEHDNHLMQLNLGITCGKFDLKRCYVDQEGDTSMKTQLVYQRTPKQVAWEMDLMQALELMQSGMGTALLFGCMETLSGKETGEGFRLGRLLF